MELLLQLLHFGPQRLQLRQIVAPRFAVPRSSKASARQATPASKPRRRRFHKPVGADQGGRLGSGGQDPARFAAPEQGSTAGSVRVMAPFRLGPGHLSLSRPGPSRSAGRANRRVLLQVNSPLSSGSGSPRSGPSFSPQGLGDAHQSAGWSRQQQPPPERHFCGSSLAPEVQGIGAKNADPGPRVGTGQVTTELRYALGGSGVSSGTTGRHSIRASEFVGRRLQPAGGAIARSSALGGFEPFEIESG